MRTTINNQIATSCGNFYCGLTINEAKDKGLDIKLFEKIDKQDGNKTGTLSADDIIEYRETNSKKHKNLSKACAVGAGLAAFAGGPIGWTIAGVSFLLGVANGVVSKIDSNETELMKEEIKEEMKRVA